MKKKIYFLRHAESLENTGTIKLRNKEALLSEKGIFQAKSVASRMKNINLDIVYTSHYERAVDTAKEIAKDSDIKYKILDYAYERLYPDSVYGLDKKDEKCQNIIKNFKKTWLENPEKVPEGGGESFLEFKNRIKKILKKAEESKFSDIAFVIHGSILKSIIVYILTDGEFDMKTFFTMYDKIGYSNTGLSLFEYSEENKKWKLIIWNDHSHL